MDTKENWNGFPPSIYLTSNKTKENKMAIVTIENVSFSTPREKYIYINDDNDYHDITNYVDIKKLQKSVEFKNQLKGRKIDCILVHLYRSKDFKNISNTKIPYKCEVCCRSEDDGSFRSSYGISVSKYPIGDAIILLKPLKN